MLNSLVKRYVQERPLQKEDVVELASLSPVQRPFAVSQAPLGE